MQAWSDCQIGDRVDIRRADNTVCFVHPTGYDFFSTLRQKLGWNRMLTPADYDELLIMLQLFHISNFVIDDEEHISFQEGFRVFYGDTGAVTSLIMGYVIYDTKVCVS